METYKEQIRFAACRMLGEKYNTRYGPLVLSWFVEHTIEEEGICWHTRYKIFSEAFDRDVPQTSLYRMLGYMAKDRVLEMKVDEQKKHVFRLNPKFVPVLKSTARFVRKEIR